MPSAAQWCFGPFRLDATAGCLWRDGQLLPLPPKPFAVLVYLVAHAGQVVSKQALLDAVWPVTAVTDGVLKTCIAELRRTLGETAQTPQYIATLHRRGYRFIASVTSAEPSPAALPASSPLPAPAAVDVQNTLMSPASLTLLVAREEELAQLHQCWRQARQGQRQVVCVTGEAGIGKTTLIDAFVTQLAATEALWIGHGQCIEQYGAGEAYLPLLEALSRLGQGPHGTRLLHLLHQYAPSWLLQLPALLPDAEIATLQRRASGATPERMLRELVEAIEALTAEQPLVLVLEDLHWSDVSTLNWLVYVARRRAAARFLVLATYRPGDALMHTHPVHSAVQDLRLHGQCAELALEYLPVSGVATYFAQRFENLPPQVGLAHFLHQHTSGNPLFLVTVLDDLVHRGGLRQEATGWELTEDLTAMASWVPTSLQQLIEQQLVRLPPATQRMLEAASVAGVQFTAAAVAAAIDGKTEDVEKQCTTLARQRQFLHTQDMATWPDGTVTAGYAFLHALHQQVLYTRVPAGQCVRWHRQIGERLEAGYGPRAYDMAAELAVHFVRGRATERAVQYLQYAGEQAVQRSAYQEALRHLTHSLELLTLLPETPLRLQQELDIQLALGPVLIATRGSAAPEVEQTYARARALCEQLGDTPQLFSTLWGLCLFYQNQGALPTARELGEQLYRLAQRTAAPTHLLEAHDVLGHTLFYLGDYAAARPHLEQGSALTNPATQRTLALRHDVALGVTCLALTALTLWCLGHPAQAVQRSEEALALAQTLAHPHSLVVAQHFAASLYHRRREASAVQAHAEALVALATAQGFPLYVGFGTCWQGWVLAMQGQGEAALAQLRQGMATVMATGQMQSRPLWLLLLAEAAGHVGQTAEGLRLVAEALTTFETGGRGDLLAEAYRLQGELLLRQVPPPAADAEACFQQALTIAHRQQARSWELRAALSLARLWQQQSQQQAAHELLAQIYSWFTEGFNTADLQETRALLAELA